jgi:hypothetical protein
MRARSRNLLIFVLTMVLLGLQPLAALAAPANDDRADATSVTAVPFYDSVDVTGATVEADEPEPSCAPIGMTVWYAVSVPKKSTLEVDTMGSEYDTVVAVYDTSLREVACNDDAGGLESRVTFSAARNTTYLVQVGAFGGYVDPEEGYPLLGISIDAASPSGNPKSERITFSGRSAQASTSFETEDGWGDAYLHVFDGLDNRQPVREVGFNAFSRYYDPAKETVTWTEWYGYGPIENAGVDRKLMSAYVDQPLEVYGYSCTGDPESEDYEGDCRELGPETVDVDVTWTGYGKLSKVRENYRETGPGGTFSFKSRSSSRSADVAGMVADTDLSFSFDGAYGAINDVKQMVMIRPSKR